MSKHLKTIWIVFSMSAAIIPWKLLTSYTNISLVMEKHSPACYPDVCIQVLFVGQRQTSVLLLGEEDAGQAWKGPGQTVHSEAEGGESPEEGGDVMQRFWRKVMLLQFYVLTGCAYFLFFRKRGKDERKTWDGAQRMNAKPRLYKWYVYNSPHSSTEITSHLSGSFCPALLEDSFFFHRLEFLT